VSTSDPTDPTRHWDGQQWLKWNGSAWLPEGPVQSPTAPYLPPAAGMPLMRGNWFGRHKIATAMLAAFVLLIVGGIAAAVGGGSKVVNAVNAAIPSAATSVPPAVLSQAPSQAPVGPVGTVSQMSALQSAQSYIAMGSGFSMAGLIDKLDSTAGEGFSKADATWAVDNLTVDWNAQAVLSAKGYMAIGGFSRASLIEQLSSSSGEKFTLAQALYAVKAVGL
jgi:hypothetical protein